MAGPFAMKSDHLKSTSIKFDDTAFFNECLEVEYPSRAGIRNLVKTPMCCSEDLLPIHSAISAHMLSIVPLAPFSLCNTCSVLPFHTRALYGRDHHRVLYVEYLPKSWRLLVLLHHGTSIHMYRKRNKA